MALEKKRVDDDWKRRAEEEKRKIAASMQPEPESDADGDVVAAADDGPTEGVSGPMRVNFLDFVKPLAMQAMSGLGQLPDPRTGMRSLDLEFARDNIDLLLLIQHKTRGRLTEEEKKTLEQLVSDLKAGFNTMARSAADAAAQEPPL